MSSTHLRTLTTSSLNWLWAIGYVRELLLSSSVSISAFVVDATSAVTVLPSRVLIVPLTLAHRKDGRN